MSRTQVPPPEPAEDEVLRWKDNLKQVLKKPKRPEKRGAMRFIAAGVIVGIFSVVGGAYAYWRTIEDLLTRALVDIHQDGEDGMNVLIVGTDSRAGLTDPRDIDRFGPDEGQRLADTIILAQILPEEKRGVLVHFPRDLYVTVHAGDRQRRSKINTAYAHGPQAVIDTVSALTRVPVNHYVEVDLRGFRAMVEAIGGIEICSERAVFDEVLNVRLPAGTSSLDGNQALSFVRSRNFTADGDFGRIRRQQQFFRAVVSKVGRPSVLANPIRVNNLAQAFARNVTVDPYFNLDDMMRLALDVRSIGTDRLSTFSVPGDLDRVGEQSVVAIDETAAEALFEALRLRHDPATGLPWSDEVVEEEPEPVEPTVCPN